MYNGWSIVEGVDDGSANYISAAGQMFSTLWFARAFPFTGPVYRGLCGYRQHGGQRPALSALRAWTGRNHEPLAGKAGMDDLVASACGVAYMDSGEIYLLPGPRPRRLPCLRRSMLIWTATRWSLRTRRAANTACLCRANSIMISFTTASARWRAIFGGTQGPIQRPEWRVHRPCGDGGGLSAAAFAFLCAGAGRTERIRCALPPSSCYPIRLEGEF